MDALGLISFIILVGGGIYSFISMCREGTRHDIHTCHKCHGAVFCSAMRTEGDTRYITYRCRECGTEFTVCRDIGTGNPEKHCSVNIDIK